jgi:hypothetical protein
VLLESLPNVMHDAFLSRNPNAPGAWRGRCGWDDPTRSRRAGARDTRTAMTPTSVPFAPITKISPTHPAEEPPSPFPRRSR